VDVKDKVSALLAVESALMVTEKVCTELNDM
jgi:hypothetical protein